VVVTGVAVSASQAATDNAKVMATAARQIVLTPSTSLGAGVRFQADCLG